MFKRVLVMSMATLALTAVASASASAALPEFVHGAGEAFPIPIELKSNGETPALFESVAFRFGECKGVSIKGEITGAKTVPLTLELEHCRSGIEEGCHTVGSQNEVFSGNGSLVYIKKATKQVGVVLKLTEGHMLCGTQELRTQGALVIPITPINTKTSTLDVTLSGEQGKSKFEFYENEKGESVRARLEIELKKSKIVRAADLSVNGGKELGLPTSKPVTINA
jgi:hypothetical protein